MAIPITSLVHTGKAVTVPRTTSVLGPAIIGGVAGAGTSEISAPFGVSRRGTSELLLLLVDLRFGAPGAVIDGLARAALASLGLYAPFNDIFGVLRELSLRAAAAAAADNFPASSVSKIFLPGLLRNTLPSLSCTLALSSSAVLLLMAALAPLALIWDMEFDSFLFLIFSIEALFVVSVTDLSNDLKVL